MCSQRIVLGLLALLAFSAVIGVSEACHAEGGIGPAGRRGADALHLRADRSVDSNGDHHIYIDTDPSYQPADYDGQQK